MKKIESKRLKFSFIVLIISYILYIVGLFFNFDPIASATGISLLNAPLYTYILGETIRKSEKRIKIDE